ncbi:hypothetical protein [Thermosulfurimonas marina]|uniref:hypothetical protein n=1 Tax=Thermosulfurimonas marina TaxID=2047767 RepID=UPI00144AE8BC|nr:hypothetical protein [Thermosulfurimonas marina]
MRFPGKDPKTWAEYLWDYLLRGFRGQRLPSCEICGRPIYERSEAYLGRKG